MVVEAFGLALPEHRRRHQDLAADVPERRATRPRRPGVHEEERGEAEVAAVGVPRPAERSGVGRADHRDRLLSKARPTPLRSAGHGTHCLRVPLRLASASSNTARCPWHPLCQPLDRDPVTLALLLAAIAKSGMPRLFSRYAASELGLHGFRKPPDDDGLSLEQLSQAFAQMLELWGRSVLGAGRGAIGPSPAQAYEPAASPADADCDVSPRRILEAMLFVGQS